MSLFSSLTNRIFLASALLVLGSIVVPVYLVNVAVTSQANAELRRGLDEAALLVNDYVSQRFENFVQVARTVADLPKLKAAVAEDHPPTVEPIARDYARPIQADLFVVTGKSGRILASTGAQTPDLASLADMLRGRLTGRESTWFWAYAGGVMRVAAIPLSTGPEPLGTLVVGYELDRATQRIKTLTNSDVVVVAGGRVVASTLEDGRADVLTDGIGLSGTFERQLGGEDYIGRVQPLGSATEPVALVLRSRTERLAFLPQLHRQIAIAGLAAVLVATLLGYAIARTVTRPLRALTTTMREMAATGDLERAVPAANAWDDEDARQLATNFRELTTSLDRFQREASQRERLSSLGRLSTVVAHEVRNPLMIIKSAVRSLRKSASPDVVEIAGSIDEEVTRINHVVADVLDFARPIRFDVQPADLVQICRDAAQAVAPAAEDVRIAVQHAEDSAPALTDRERLRSVLVNLLTNAQHAVKARESNGHAPPPILIRTIRQHGRWLIEVEDRGIGIPAGDLDRIFEPFFTTRRTGSGLGLALARNVVEGLGGTIAVESQPDAGTTVRIDLPERPLTS